MNRTVQKRLEALERRPQVRPYVTLVVLNEEGKVIMAAGPDCSGPEDIDLDSCIWVNSPPPVLARKRK
jgi:hypothetical protein